MYHIYRSFGNITDVMLISAAEVGSLSGLILVLNIRTVLHHYRLLLVNCLTSLLVVIGTECRNCLTSQLVIIGTECRNCLTSLLVIIGTECRNCLTSL